MSNNMAMNIHNVESASLWRTQHDDFSTARLVVTTEQGETIEITLFSQDVLDFEVQV